MGQAAAQAARFRGKRHASQCEEEGHCPIALLLTDHRRTTNRAAKEQESNAAGCLAGSAFSWQTPRITE